MSTAGVARSLDEELEDVLHQFAPNPRRPAATAYATTATTTRVRVNPDRTRQTGVRIDPSSDDYNDDDTDEEEEVATTTTATTTDDGDTDDETGTFTTIDGDEDDSDAPMPPPRSAANSAAAAYHQRHTNLFKQAPAAPIVRNGWEAMASVNDCVSDLERELAALLCHHRKHCQVTRRSVQECDDRIRWLDDFAALVENERRAAKSLRDVLSTESQRAAEVEGTIRHIAESQKTIGPKDFFPLELEEIRADSRLKKLDDDAAELKEVMKTLTERETSSKARQKELTERESKVRIGLDELERKQRQRQQQELRLQERERTAVRHEAAIETWSRTLDNRESELAQRRSHLDRCFRALEKAESQLGLLYGANAATGAKDGQLQQQQNSSIHHHQQQQQQQQAGSPNKSFGAGNSSFNMMATASTTVKLAASTTIGGALPHMALEAEDLALDGHSDDDEGEL